MKLYSQKDVDKKALKGARIAVLGYGSQGRAHALNLKDSGFDVVVGVRKGGASWKKAKKDGLEVAEPADAVDGADLVAHAGAGPRAEGAVRARSRQAIKKGADAAVRARLQRALQADQAAQGPRRRADRAEGSGRPGAPPVPAGPRRAVPASPSRRTPPARRTPAPSPTPTASAAPAAACSRRPSPRRPRRICSANRRCCAAAPPSWW